ncbi:tetraspanin tsp3 [Diaporthe eres]|uniref:Tetraspanin Tsp3 n=2 Tax=Diaporthe vaccinii TaxID=105482 RepID=A0ABR4F6I5_9PEZI|nr:tetraspanin tsp3 [Diaporthe eres]
MPDNTLKMSWLLFAYPVLILALMGVALYEHTNSVTLSLPLSPVLTFLTILLPLFAAANATALPYLLREKARSPRRLLVRLAHPVVTQGLQGIIIVVLATLYTTYIVPGATRDCGLSNIWERLFRTKDAQSVKAIQDAFECCGFRSVKHMAWPFPPVDIACAQRFDRALPCRGPWTSALQRSAGVELGVIIVVAILQIASLVFPQQFAARFNESSWRRFFGGRRPHGSDVRPSQNRPLITGGEASSEADEEVGHASQTNGYHYGTLDERNGDGPRIEPSSLRQDGNEWRDE